MHRSNTTMQLTQKELFRNTFIVLPRGRHVDRYSRHMLDSLLETLSFYHDNMTTHKYLFYFCDLKQHKLGVSAKLEMILYQTYIYKCIMIIFCCPTLDKTIFVYILFLWTCCRTIFIFILCFPPI